MALIRYKSAHLSNLNRVADLYERAFATGPERPWHAEKLQASLAHDGVELFTLQKATSLAPSAAALVRITPPEAELWVIATDPDASREGLARQLMDDIVAACSEAGCDSLWLDVRADNTAARALYKRVGAEEISRRKNYYMLRDGSRADALTMRITFTLP